MIAEGRARALLFALATLIATGSLAYAHTGATGIVKERMDLMKQIGDANKQLAPIFKGAIAYDAQTVREAASVMAEHGGRAMTELFPDGSLDMPTEALPMIWLEWARFETLADDLSRYARALAAAADNPRPEGTMPMGADGMMSEGMVGDSGPSEAMLASMPPDAAYMQVAQTCKACHQDFRMKKN